MNPQTLEQAVAAHPFLMGVNEHHIRLLADSAVQTTFEAGELIFREGETANRFYLIESGKVVLESPGKGNEPVTIDVVGAGICSVGHGSSLRLSGTSPPARSSRRTRSSSTAQCFVNIATQIRHSASNCSSE